MFSKLFRFLLLAPFVYWGVLVFGGYLGADPAKNLNHKTGEIALYYLILNLLIGIIISFSIKLPKYFRFLLTSRRYLGVLSFCILIIHMLLYLVMESFEEKAFTQMYTKTYLIFAVLAWLILFALTLTSNDISVKKLGGKKWKFIHRSVYIASLFFSIHILLIEKADLIKYGFILSGLWLVQGIRFVKYLIIKKNKTHEH